MFLVSILLEILAHPLSKLVGVLHVSTLLEILVQRGAQEPPAVHPPLVSTLLEILVTDEVRALLVATENAEFQPFLRF